MAIVAMGVSSQQRFTAPRACPVCGGHDGVERGNGVRCFGFISDDGKFAHCSREEHARNIVMSENSSTFAHYLHGLCRCGKVHWGASSFASGATNGKAKEKEKKPAKFDPERDTVFYYRDLAGKPLYAVVRMGRDKNKTFQAHKADGKWWWGIPDDASNVPYRLCEVVKAISEDKTIHIFEGEPDADKARKLGLVATTNIRGAGKFTDDLVPYFVGADVVINGDNDDEGRKHVDQVATKLHGVSNSVKAMPPFPGVGEGGDFRNWLKAGGTVEEYLKMVEETPANVSLNQGTPIPLTSDLKKHFPVYRVREIKEMREEGDGEGWYCPLFMRAGEITLFGGMSKESGKTTYYCHMLKKVHDGELFMGMPTKKSGALILTEQGSNILEATAKAGISDDDDIYFAFYKDLAKEEWSNLIEAATATCKELGVGILVVDTFGSFADLHGSDENISGEIAERMKPVLVAVRVHGLHVSILHHTGKDGDLRGSSNFRKDPDAIWLLGKPTGDHGPNVRSLKGWGRHDPINTSFNIELTDDGYVMLGTNTQIERAKAESKWLELMPVGFDNHVRRTQVMPVVTRTTNVSESTAQRALEYLVDQGIVKQQQLQAQGKPVVLWKPEMFKSPPPESNGPSEAVKLEESPANNRKTEGQGLFKSEVGGIGGKPDLNPEPEPKKKKHYTLLDLARADKELAAEHNLIYREKHVPRVLEWLVSVSEVGVDVETCGTAELKGERRKLALSFVHGKIRLIQLSDGETTYIVDAALLRTETVATVLEALRGKTLILHGAVFDLPRLKRYYGVDLMDEDVVDTMVLSRLTRSGELDATGKPVEHSLGAVLKTEGVAKISKDTDHEWQESLNTERLRYAIDDVRYLPALREALMRLVEERDQTCGLELFMPAYREYMRMQYRGVPLDLDRFNSLLEKFRTRAENALSLAEELAPEHPEGGTWSWGNKLKPDAMDRHGNNVGRNGALRALHLAGIKLGSLKKETRTEYLRKHKDAELLGALDEYYRYSDLYFDAKGWLDYSVEDGRLYPNINPFSQVTGRSAYSDPALQNTPKQPDEEGSISLRDCIRAPEGHKIVAADYAAQELRLVASIAGDEDLIKAFADGDPHLQVAKKIAGKKLERGTEEGEKYRQLGKTVNYGFTYGQGAMRFQQYVYQKTSERMDEKEAKAAQKAFQQTWRGVHRWQKRFGSRSGSKDEHWYTESFVGRRRYVSHKWDTELAGWKPAFTDRLNGPVQSGGADMLYTAMNLLREDQQRGMFTRVNILLTTHDEIALEAPEAVAEDARMWLEARMRDAARQFLCEELAGEDCVEGAVGDSWGGN
jgi:DNA polymerase I-like protein with 3'-5' exonuclease and polymerase domains